MRRARDEDCVNSQLKRPNSSPSRQINMANEASTNDSGRLTTSDALAYLKSVKDIFHDKKEKYDEFLEVMKDFKSKRIDTAGVIERVKVLFNGYRHLILGFNTFLPKGYEIKLTTEVKKPIDFREAIVFVNKIKNRFQNEDNVYKTFLGILNMYRKERKTIREVYSEVADLFGEHPDLLNEFTHFLPDTSAVATAQHGSSARTLLHGFKFNSPVQEGTYNSHTDHELSVDHLDVERDKKKRRHEREKDRRDRERDEKDMEHDFKDLDNVQRRLKPSRRVDDAMTEHLHEVGEGAENFATFSISTSSYDDKNALKSVYPQEVSYFEKVKEKLHPAAYNEFLKCIYIYNQEIISQTELKRLLQDLITEYPDLMDGLDKIFTSPGNVDGFVTGVINKKSLWNEGHKGRPFKLEERDRARLCDKDEMLKERDHERERERDRERERTDKGVSCISKDVAAHRNSLPINKEKYNWNKPISELDLSNCQRCTPSYRLLPKNYPLPAASYRTELGTSVLNDLWVSVTSGSEDYSFKHMRKNQFEESLFRCEDDRFELDMLLESANAAIKRVEELVEKMQDDTFKMENLSHIEDYFTPLNLRCIERLYGDHGLDVMDIMRKNPVVAFPVILSRLKQKQEEWSRSRSDFNKVWAEIYARNYQKSLDHRSFYFKQHDTKSLSAKSLLTEIKEINERKLKEDNVLLAIAAGNQLPIFPNMQFEYSDSDVHEDLYKIVKYSCGEVCTSDQFDKVMRIWTNFVEPFLGVPPRVQGTEDAVDVVRSKGSAVKSNSASTRENKGCGSDDAVGNTKQLKPIRHADANSLGEHGDLQKTILVDSVRTTGGPAFHDVHCVVVGDDNPCSSPCNGKVQGAAVADGTPLFSRQASAGQLMDDASITARAEEIQVRASHDIASGPGLTPARSGQADMDKIVEPQINHEFLPSKGGENLRSIVFSNDGCPSENNKVHKHRDSSSPGNQKIEREEGELSPNGDFEEDNFVVFDDQVPAVKDNNSSVQCQEKTGAVACSSMAAGDNDADADDEGEESAHRTTEDSENASEAGEDASGSESVDGEECSHEDNEEEDVGHDDPDGKPESEGEAEGTPDALDADVGGTSERFLPTVKPLAKYVHEAFKDSDDKCLRCFYGNDSFYLLFRLHQTLYERILSAKMNSSNAERKWKTMKDTSSPDLYAKFMGALYNLLDGSADNTKFEDDCRSLIGTQSYVLFTLDKLIYKIVKQLQAVASDDVENRLLQLYAYEKSRGRGKFVDVIYHENARLLLHDESIYRFEFSSDPARLSIQLMDYGNGKPEVISVSIDPNFAAYLHNDFLSREPDWKRGCIFMGRNKRKLGDSDDYSVYCKAMDGVQVVNGLECKMSCNSSKVRYVLDTEDLFVRARKKRRLSDVGRASCPGQAQYLNKNTLRMQRYHHKFLT
ncbi:paired amphipathic helix protein Sin3-like 4 isoform X2 [Dioscorea cayenensis subsp. rotundata]|uniref:Paired amphipathic helix protein Sin3-like 4 isoform X2 n=1 Tax=Dioscorea cayennensis subsp. rotundata TaxID=55577 RepID=A0AB40B1I9_DIOCR|nr:paired amphipathic helix protein Sin3-like 4 isoform X2 [Dioscorea cayenensis subsp. rotundata]